jgi:SAM-dependent MidA family methyltransferase
MCSANSNNILPEPTEELKCVSEQLSNLIRERIALNGPISFSEYMEMALYEPGLGYYSAGLQKFGQGGDFVTAPQLGDVFARCLAKQIEQIAAELCEPHPGSYEIIEAGAGSGILAADLLKTLQDTRPPSRYQILERSAHLRQVQTETLQKHVPQWMDKISWLDEPPEEDWQGIFLANEVLDALTVDRFCIEADGINGLRVTHGPGGFDWVTGPCSQAMQTQVQAILSGLEDKPGVGYRSEFNTNLAAWLDTVTTSHKKGVALFIDYGYTRGEYFRPQRRDGTLICHYQQRAHDDPFRWPGLTDISASVDFTALAEAADLCGFEVCGYTTQAMFLLASGLDGILGEVPFLAEKERIGINNQVRRLTLPAEMGERFQVMALARGLDEAFSEDLQGFRISDLRYRL